MALKYPALKYETKIAIPFAIQLYVIRYEVGFAETKKNWKLLKN